MSTCSRTSRTSQLNFSIFARLLMFCTSHPLTRLLMCRKNPHKLREKGLQIGAFLTSSILFWTLRMQCWRGNRLQSVRRCYEDRLTLSTLAITSSWLLCELDKNKCSNRIISSTSHKCSVCKIVQLSFVFSILYQIQCNLVSQIQQQPFIPSRCAHELLFISMKLQYVGVSVIEAECLVSPRPSLARNVRCSLLTD